MTMAQASVVVSRVQVISLLCPTTTPSTTTWYHGHQARQASQLVDDSGPSRRKRTGSYLCRYRLQLALRAYTAALHW
ncbi:hypothetical protein HDK64DRAFT_76422 [Phyllosticta capitalensis]